MTNRFCLTKDQCGYLGLLLCTNSSAARVQSGLIRASKIFWSFFLGSSSSVLCFPSFPLYPGGIWVHSIFILCSCSFGIFLYIKAYTLSCTPNFILVQLALVFIVYYINLNYLQQPCGGLLNYNSSFLPKNNHLLYCPLSSRFAQLLDK